MEFKIGEKIIVVKALCPQAEEYIGKSGIVGFIDRTINQYNIHVDFYTHSAFRNRLNFSAEELMKYNKTAKILYGAKNE